MEIVLIVAAVWVLFLVLAVGIMAAAARGQVGKPTLGEPPRETLALRGLRLQLPRRLRRGHEARARTRVRS